MPTPVLNRPEFKSLAYDQIEQRLDDYLARGRELMKQLGSNATPSWAELIEPEESLHDELPVSYTHLTLPTILLV